MENASTSGEEAMVQTVLSVKDLDGTVTEEQLKQLFGQVGGVNSVKICVDEATKESLGYGYVSYSNPEDAAKAMELLNITFLNGKSIIITCSEGSLPKTSLGTLFFTNLDKEIDENALRERFSAYGNVVSCRVILDSSGTSQGYGYVQFDNEEDARNATQHLNCVQFNGKKLFSPFESNSIIRGSNGRSKGPGFVEFSAVEESPKARDDMNGKLIRSKHLYVGIGERNNNINRSSLQDSTKLVHPKATYTPPSFGAPVFHPPMCVYDVRKQPVPHVWPSGGILYPQLPHMHQQSQGSTIYATYMPPSYGAPAGVGQHNFYVPLLLPPVCVYDVRKQPVPRPGVCRPVQSTHPTVLQNQWRCLYPVVEQLVGDHMAPTVMGLLLDLDQTQVLHLLESPHAVQAKVSEAMDFLAKYE